MVSPIIKNVSDASKEQKKERGSQILRTGYNAVPTLIQMLKRKVPQKGRYKRKGTRSGTIDYDSYSYCITCENLKPKDMLFCDYCGRKVRHKPSGKQAKYWKERLKFIE